MDSEVLSAGEIIRNARKAASLSQSELARRARVAQSVVSAYEADRRSPSWEMLKKLIAASGSRLDLTITPIPGAPRGLPNTEMGQRIRQHRRAILAAAEKYQVTNLRVFGGVARGEDSLQSDVDIVAEFLPTVGLIALGSLEREIATILNCRVDLVPLVGLRPQVLALVEAEGVQI